MVALKVKLSFEEKTYVENNRFTKLQASGSDSEDDGLIGSARPDVQ